MSFRLKTIFGVALIESVLLFVLVISSLDYLRHSNQAELHKRAFTTAELLAATALDGILTKNLAALKSYVEEVVTDPDIVYARISDNRDILAQAGDPIALARPFQLDDHFRGIRDGILDAEANVTVAGAAYGRVEVGFSVGPIDAVMARATRHMSFIAGTELALVALFSFLLGTYLTRELKALRVATGRVADGDLDYRIKVRGNDELAQTAQAFNAMAQKVQSAFSERDNAQQALNALNQALEDRVRQRTEQLVSLNRELEHKTLHDSLTNIPNRTLLNDRLAQQLALGQRNNAPFALAVLDLDGFKEVNDVKGHQTGDLVLQSVANRLSLGLRRFDTVARMGGDEFALLLPDVANEEEARAVAEHISETISRPLELGGERLEVGGSLGIALFPDHGDDAETLIRRADSAMY